MIRLLSLFIVIIFTGCSRGISSQPLSLNRPVSSSPAFSQGSTYLVKKGDSLWRISKQCGVPVEKIMEANRIRNPHELKVGQKLDLPVCSYQVKKTGAGEFIWPVRGEIVSFYGEKTGNVVNQGINIKTGAAVPVKACAQGRVVYADYLRGWGKTVIIKHQDSYYTFYCNMDEIKVHSSAAVGKGDSIGKVGASGSGSKQVFHFEIRKGHLPQDPLQYLNS